MKKNKIVEIIGGIHRVASVNEQPEIILQRWSVREVSGYLGQTNRRTRHFVGWNVEDSEGRASTPIIMYDPVTCRGKTESGRVYELRGDPGFQADAEYIWKRWAKINAVTDEADVTVEYAPHKPTLDDVRDEVGRGENTGRFSR